MQISKAALQALRERFPKGTRVELVTMDDPQAPPIGTKGTVLHVDSIGTIHVAWDNGSGLGVCYGEDSCKIINRRIMEMTGKTIIRQLFYGELHPCERFVHPKSEIRKTSKNIGNMAEKMINHLSEADAEQLQEIIDELYHYSSLLESDAFESGFRLGGKMMLDILQPDAKVVIPDDTL